VAWTESGIYYQLLRDTLKSSGNIVAGWDATTNKIALYSNSDTPGFQDDPATFSSTNEVFGTGWATGGVLVSAAGAGSTSLAPAFSIVGTAPTTTLKFDYTTDLSVASTTLANARGCKMYRDALSPKALVVAIWFGGSDYSTSAGTFAITFSPSGVIIVTLAA
jgi:hypothetical protein